MEVNYIDRDFILNSNISRKLYFEFANNIPIIDYHNHIDVSKLTGKYFYGNITKAWIDRDPYKHRLMRLMGIHEDFITGNALDLEKFEKWASVFPKLIGNPVFYWSCLELYNLFGISEMLNSDNFLRIWNKCNGIIQKYKNFDFYIFRRLNVSALFPSEDLFEDLYKYKILESDREFENIIIKPSLRFDHLFSIDNEWILKLEKKLNVNINSLDILLKIFERRINYFQQFRFQIADFSLDYGFKFSFIEKKECYKLFIKIRSNNYINLEDQFKFGSFIFTWFMTKFKKLRIGVQLHIGAIRNINTKLKNLIGSRAGGAVFGESVDTENLIECFNYLEVRNILPKIILFNSNPGDVEKFSLISSSFGYNNFNGYISLGPPWWFNDHENGIKDYFDSLSNYNLLSNCIGMTTDSRSNISLLRHDYFRRILANYLDELIDRKLIPYDSEILKEIIESICFNNINNWLNK